MHTTRWGNWKFQFVVWWKWTFWLKKLNHIWMVWANEVCKKITALIRYFLITKSLCTWKKTHKKFSKTPNVDYKKSRKNEAERKKWNNISWLIWLRLTVFHESKRMKNKLYNFFRCWKRQKPQAKWTKSPRQRFIRCY